MPKIPLITYYNERDFEHEAFKTLETLNDHLGKLLPNQVRRFIQNHPILTKKNTGGRFMWESYSAVSQSSWYSLDPISVTVRLVESNKIIMMRMLVEEGFPAEWGIMHAVVSTTRGPELTKTLCELGANMKLFNGMDVMAWLGRYDQNMAFDRIQNPNYNSFWISLTILVRNGLVISDGLPWLLKRIKEACQEDNDLPQAIADNAHLGWNSSILRNIIKLKRCLTQDQIARVTAELLAREMINST